MPPIDYSRYPANWKTEIVPAVLERAWDCCEQCLLGNGQVVFAIKLNVKSADGKYGKRMIWFRDQRDAIRENGNSEIGVFMKKVVLTVAHLDHDETNHDVKIDRLKAFCQLCHLRYDAKEKYRRSQEKRKQHA